MKITTDHNHILATTVYVYMYECTINTTIYYIHTYILPYVHIMFFLLLGLQKCMYMIKIKLM